MIAHFKGSTSFGSKRAQMSFVKRFKVRRSMLSTNSAPTRDHDARRW
jgi:hypothetical protein